MERLSTVSSSTFRQFTDLMESIKRQDDDMFVLAATSVIVGVVGDLVNQSCKRSDCRDARVGRSRVAEEFKGSSISSQVAISFSRWKTYV